MEKLRSLFQIVGDFTVSFRDIDNEKCVVNDDYDLDYMMANTEGDNALTVDL